ncbi:MAG: Nramp family divalent metal transporter, partial [Verrucomicrobiia bacterium]
MENIRPTEVAHAGDASQRRSLPEVHGSVAIPAGASLWKKILAYSGPAYLVSVGYMDPGNWATNIEAGSRFGYKLLWVLFLSNLMALLLQTLAARLGIVTGRDLAQACREHYSKRVSLALWVLCEIAIAACDLAEVLGGAVGLNLLTGLPLLACVCVMAADVFLILFLQGRGMRLLEAVVVTLVATIGFCYVIEIFFARPDLAGVFHGLFTPRLTGRGN